MQICLYCGKQIEIQETKHKKKHSSFQSTNSYYRATYLINENTHIVLCLHLHIHGKIRNFNFVPYENLFSCHKFKSKVFQKKITKSGTQKNHQCSSRSINVFQSVEYPTVYQIQQWHMMLTGIFDHLAHPQPCLVATQKPRNTHNPEVRNHTPVNFSSTANWHLLPAPEFTQRLIEKRGVTSHLVSDHHAQMRRSGGSSTPVLFQELYLLN